MITVEQRDKWADALESGDYTQIRGCWFSQSFAAGKLQSACCLTVLALSTGVDEKLWISNQIPIRDYLESYLTGYAIDNFVDMNDRQGLTFKQIAQEVRKLEAST